MTHTDYTADDLTRRTVHRRAVEAVNWGMPAVNFDLMLQAATAAGAGPNQIVYWSRLQDWTNQTLTPNPDVIYFMPFIDMSQVGPVVIEIPPADEGTINGSIMDCWQNALEDVGPAGVDQGQGGKYLVLPPGYTEAIPDGYIALRSDTVQGYALLRSVLKTGSDADLAHAITYGQRIRLYPLNAADNPPQPTMIDVAGQMFDATIPYDDRFFISLARMVQTEPWLTRDKVMIDLLASLGIVKGQPFTPDDARRDVLTDAAQEAHAWLEARYAHAFTPGFYPDGHWAFPASPALSAGLPTFFADPNAYPIDDRGLVYSYAFFSAKHMGQGQFYLMTIADQDGAALDGSATYRLTVPAQAPVTQYWSATVYTRATHTLLHEVPWCGRSSQTPAIQANPDGSVTVIFGPQAPEGQEANWVPTRAGESFEVLVRFYGPTAALFDQSWRLPDLVRDQA